MFAVFVCPSSGRERAVKRLTEKYSRTSILPNHVREGGRCQDAAIFTWSRTTARMMYSSLGYAWLNWQMKSDKCFLNRDLEQGTVCALNYTRLDVGSLWCSHANHNKMKLLRLLTLGQRKLQRPPKRTPTWGTGHMFTSVKMIGFSGVMRS